MCAWSTKIHRYIFFGLFNIVYGKWSIVYVIDVLIREVESTVGQNIIVIGGGGAGLGAAGGAKAVDPLASVTVFTENEDVAYSPCGIPFVHGKEIPSFEALFLADKQSYVDAGIEVRYQTKITAIDTSTKTVQIESDQPMRYDSLVISTGFSYANPGVPGGELDGLYYVKNIREAMEWDKRLDTVKKAVVVEASPLGVEMITALAHRGIETHVIDPNPWALGELADPDIVELAQESWAELGVTMHWNTSLQEFLGNESGAVRGVRTSNGDIECDLVVVATHKVPNSELAVAAGLKTGSTGGLIVDGGMQTSAAGVWASGDICEIPHGLGGLPLQGLTGSHAYAQGKVAGANAAGGNRT